MSEPDQTMWADDDLVSDYRRAGFGQGLGPGEQLAVVVVDACRAYAEPESPLYLA